MKSQLILALTTLSLGCQKISGPIHEHDATRPLFSTTPVFGSVVQITTDPGSDALPRVSGDSIVWQGTRNGNTDVFLWDGNSQSNVTSDPAFQGFPAISGGRIVWRDLRNGPSQVFVLDPTVSPVSGPIQPLATGQLGPAIDGSLVVWAEFRDTSREILMFDLNSSTETRITMDGANQDANPEISGQRIIYSDPRNGDFDAFMYDLTTSLETTVASGPGNQFALDIDGCRIVVKDENVNPLQLYDVCTNQNYSFPTNTGRARISGDFAAAEINGRPFLIHLPTGAETMIVDEQGIIFNVDISGNRIVWDNNSDIFTVEFAFTPQQQVAAVADEVQGLVDNGTLTQDQADGLINKLNEIIDSIEAGKPCQAISGKVGSFTNQVNAFTEPTGPLTQAQGQQLIDAVQTAVSEVCP